MPRTASVRAATHVTALSLTREARSPWVCGAAASSDSKDIFGLIGEEKIAKMHAAYAALCVLFLSAVMWPQKSRGRFWQRLRHPIFWMFRMHESEASLMSWSVCNEGVWQHPNLDGPHSLCQEHHCTKAVGGRTVARSEEVLVAFEFLDLDPGSMLKIAASKRLQQFLPCDVPFGSKQ